MNYVYTDVLAVFRQLLDPLFFLLSPVLGGLILAYLLRPIFEWFRNYLAKGWAIFLTYFSAFLFLFGILYGFLILILGALPSGGLQENLNLVTAYFQSAYDSATRTLEQWLPPQLPEGEELTRMITQWFTAKFSLSTVLLAATKVSSLLFRGFLAVVISIYLLKDYTYFLRIWNQLLSLVLKQKHHGILCELTEQMDQVLTTFLKGILIDSLLVALFSSTALTLLDVDYGVIIGGLGGILNIIPYFGPFFSMIPAFLVALFTEGIGLALPAVGALFLVQQIDSNILYPRIVGNSTGLHPLFVLLSVTFSGYFFGITGMLLAVPAAGTIQVLIKHWAGRK